MGQLVHVSVITQETLMNMDSPREMTPSCTNQILSEKQHCEIWVWKGVLKQKR